MDIELPAGPCYVELGTLQGAPAPNLHDRTGTSARVVDVLLRPSGRLVEARVAHLGQGLGRGVFAPLEPDDQVLVFLPAGDANQAVVLGSLGSVLAPNPIANDGAKALVMHPGGVELRSADGLEAQGVVLAALLPGLLDLLSALQLFMATASSATTAPQIAAAAASFLADPAVATLAGELGTSVGADAPYASPSVRATL